MLDVHAPYEALQTWKGFVIHIATICIGLLIAIALDNRWRLSIDTGNSPLSGMRGVLAGPAHLLENFSD